MREWRGMKIYLIVCGLIAAASLIAGANGVDVPHALNVRKMASAGQIVRILRCDKVVSRHTNYSDYLVTAESLSGDNRVTVEVNINRSPLPQAGEVWKVDASGWWVVFTERVRGEK